MKHYLRKGQVFTFNWDTCKKFLVARNPSNLEVLAVEDNERIVTQYKKETKPGGWERNIEEQVNCTIKDKYVLNAQFKVLDIVIAGGGTGHGPHDVYPDGQYVKAQRVSHHGYEEVGFYQSGCFTGMIYPEHLNLISGPEDKEVTLKQIWVETNE